MMIKKLLRPTRKRLIALATVLLLASAAFVLVPRAEGSKDEKLAPEVKMKDLAEVFAAAPQVAPDAGAVDAEDVVVEEVVLTPQQQLLYLAQNDHIGLLEMCLENTAQYQDYALTFEKQERIKGKLGDSQTIDVIHRAAPFSVGMRWTENAPQGDRVIYTEGQRNNQMLIHPTDGAARFFVGEQVLRDPHAKEVMDGTLKPITIFGFTNSLTSLVDMYRLAEERGDLRTEFVGVGEMAGREVLIINRFLPDRPDYDAAKTTIYIDIEYLVPVMIEGYDWSDDEKLVARYLFRDIKFNVGLTEEDFSAAAFGMKEK